MSGSNQQGVLYLWCKVISCKRTCVFHVDLLNSTEVFNVEKSASLACRNICSVWLLKQHDFDSCVKELSMRQ